MRRVLFLIILLMPWPAHAGDIGYVVNYEHERTAIIVRGQNLAIEVSPYAIAKAYSGGGTVKSFHKVVMVGANGGSGCTTFLTADAGESLGDRGCVLVKRSGNRYRVQISHILTYPNLKGIVKDYPDATQRSDVVLDLVVMSGSCAAVMARKSETSVIGKQTSNKGHRAACEIL